MVCSVQQNHYILKWDNPKLGLFIWLPEVEAMTKSLHTPEYTALLRTLIDARKRSGMTQQDVADRLGKPQSYIAKVEGGERRLDVVEFISVAKAIGENPTALFDRLLAALDAIPD